MFCIFGPVERAGRPLDAALDGQPGAAAARRGRAAAARPPRGSARPAGRAAALGEGGSGGGSRAARPSATRSARGAALGPFGKRSPMPGPPLDQPGRGRSIAECDAPPMANQPAARSGRPARRPARRRASCGLSSDSPGGRSAAASSAARISTRRPDRRRDLGDEMDAVAPVEIVGGLRRGAPALDHRHHRPILLVGEGRPRTGGRCARSAARPRPRPRRATEPNSIAGVTAWAVKPRLVSTASPVASTVPLQHDEGVREIVAAELARIEGDLDRGGGGRRRRSEQQQREQASRADGRPPSRAAQPARRADAGRTRARGPLGRRATAASRRRRISADSLRRRRKSQTGRRQSSGRPDPFVTQTGNPRLAC